MWRSELSASTSAPSGRLDESLRVYKEALGLAQQSGDQEAVDQVLEGLKEVKKRRNQEKEEKPAEN